MKKSFAWLFSYVRKDESPWIWERGNLHRYTLNAADISLLDLVSMSSVIKKEALRLNAAAEDIDAFIEEKYKELTKEDKSDDG